MSRRKARPSRASPEAPREDPCAVGWLFDLDQAREPVDRAEVHRLVDHLLDVREAMRPGANVDPVTASADFSSPYDSLPRHFTEAYGKARIANRVVTQTRGLAIALAGWAINHNVGEVLNRAVGDDCHSHRHEELGREVARAGPEGHKDMDNSFAARAVLRQGLQLAPVPLFLGVSVQEGLDALDMGEAVPIFTPAISGKHGRVHTLAVLRLKAIQLANYHHGRGVALHLSETEVAKALGIEHSRLKSWETKLLPKLITKKTVTNRIKAARNAGEFFAAALSDNTLRVRAESEVLSYEWNLLQAALYYERQSLQTLRSQFDAAQVKQPRGAP